MIVNSQRRKGIIALRQVRSADPGKARIITGHLQHFLQKVSLSFAIPVFFAENILCARRV
jgi:hypothetical protein